MELFQAGNLNLFSSGLQTKEQSMKKILLVLMSMLMSGSLLLSACGAPAPQPTATATATATIAATETPAATATVTLTPTATLPPLSDEPVEIRWFVGTGTGSDPAQVVIEKQVVNTFNQ